MSEKAGTAAVLRTDRTDPDGEPYLHLLHRALESFRAAADRSDPLDATVLQLIECAALAAAAASALRVGRLVDPADPSGAAVARGALHESLAAARAAVVSASYGVTQAGRHDPVISQRAAGLSHPSGAGRPAALPRSPRSHHRRS